MTTSAAKRCRVEWCRKSLEAGRYSFGDGLGNVYQKCGGGHWTPEPPPPDLTAIDNADDFDWEGATSVTSLETHREARGGQDGADAPAHAQAHVRDHDARRRGGSSGRADRSTSQRPSDDDALRPGQGEPGPARELHLGGIHGGSQLEKSWGVAAPLAHMSEQERLKLHAGALATLAGTYRRAFIGVAR